LSLVRAALLPVSELPVVAIHEDGHYSLPSGLGEAYNTVVNIEGHVSAVDCLLTSGLGLPRSIAIIFIDAAFKELLGVSNREVAANMHGRNNYNWPRSLSNTEVVTVWLDNFVQKVVPHLGLEFLYIQVHVFSDSASLLDPCLGALGCLVEADHLVTKLKHFKEALLLALENIHATVNALLVHEDVVDHF